LFSYYPPAAYLRASASFSYCDPTLTFVNLFVISVGRSTAASVQVLKQREPVLKEANASFTTRKNKAGERKEKDQEIRTTVEGVTLVLFPLKFLNLG